MKKIIVIIIATFSAIVLLTGCNTESIVEPIESGNSDGGTVMVSGRIIETVDGEYTIIRNEVDTKIYYKIDISAGLKAEDGVSTVLEPDNVIYAKVEILNDKEVPITSNLVSLTSNIAPDYKVIDAKEAKAMIDEGNVIIIDVRTREEYQSGYIPDSFNLPLGTIEAGISNITADKQAVLLVYCRSGNRSKVAARELTELGYVNVYDFGGIVDWPYDIAE